LSFAISAKVVINTYFSGISVQSSMHEWFMLAILWPPKNRSLLHRLVPWKITRKHQN